jgi:hypothetical protein
MTAKTLTDAQLAELGRLASQQLAAAAEAWTLGMSCLRLDSREYRALCAAGKAAERNYRCLWLLAEARGWTSEQSDEVFTIASSYSWN